MDKADLRRIITASSASSAIGGYPRISEDPDDVRNGVTRQIKDIRDTVEQYGGDPERVMQNMYEENNTSAYKKKKIRVTDPVGNEYWGYRVIRPKWHQALQDLRIGKIKVLVVWDLDRLARDPRDLEDAIEAVEHYGATIISATASEIDLTTESGVMMARFMVIIGHKASADTARRVKRVHLDTAQAGKPVGGTRPFGWEDDKVTLREQEADAIQAAARRLLQGASLNSVVRWFNEQGLTTSRGNSWTTATMRQMLKSPRLAGFRIYQGKILYGKDGLAVRGTWTPILDEDVWRAIVGRFEFQARVGARPASQRHILSGVARCGLCGSGMRHNAAPAKNTGYLACPDPGKGGCGGVAISAPKALAVVEQLLLDHWSSWEKNPIIRASVPWPKLQDLSDKQERRAKLMRAFEAGTMSEESVFPSVARLDQDIKELRREQRAWEAEEKGSQERTWSPLKDWREARDTEGRRALLQGWVHAVVVQPAPKRGGRFDPSRLKVVWKDGTGPSSPTPSRQHSDDRPKAPPS